MLEGSSLKVQPWCVAMRAVARRQRLCAVTDGVGFVMVLIRVAAGFRRAVGRRMLAALGVGPWDLRSATVVCAQTEQASFQHSWYDKRKKKRFSMTVTHRRARRAPIEDQVIPPELELVYFLREGPMEVTPEQRHHLLGITGGSLRKVLDALATAQWSPLLIVDMKSRGAAERLGLTSNQELVERWRRDSASLKAMKYTGIVGQARPSKSGKSEDLWCAA
jgi:hypothetical protein